MSKNLIINVTVVSCILLLTWFLFPNKTKLANYPPKGVTTVMFGDSLVQGVGATEGNDLPNLLSKKVGVPIINLGKSGNTTADGLARIDEALEQKPNVVMILLGGNDSLRRISPEQTETNLRNIVSAFQEAGAITIILGVRGGILGDPYKSIYKDVAKSTGSAYVSDVLSGLFVDARYMSDALHPNDVGYAKIANRVGPVLFKILNKNY